MNYVNNNLKPKSHHYFLIALGVDTDKHYPHEKVSRNQSHDSHRLARDWFKNNLCYVMLLFDSYCPCFKIVSARHLIMLNKTLLKMLEYCTRLRDIFIICSLNNFTNGLLLMSYKHQCLLNKNI